MNRNQSQFSKDMDSVIDDLQKLMRVAAGLGHITYNLAEDEKIDFDTAMRIRYLIRKIDSIAGFTEMAIDEIYHQQSKEA